MARRGTAAKAWTVGACYERWWKPAALETLARSSLMQYEAAWRRAIEPRWGTVPARLVRPLEMQEWLLTLSRSTAEQSCKILGRLFELLVMYEIVERNPMRLAYRLPPVGSCRDKGIYTFCELLERWHELEGSEIELPFLLAAFGSARVGESLGVRLDMPGELSFERASNGMVVACVRIERQVDRNGTVSTRLKTPASRRVLTLPEPMSLRMRTLVERGRAEGKTWMVEGASACPMSQQVLNRLWKASFIGSKLELHPFRNLRNSWRTFMHWEMGIEDDKLEKMMGHAGGSMAARYYDRPDASMFVEAVAAAFAGAGR